MSSLILLLGVGIVMMLLGMFAAHWSWHILRSIEDAHFTKTYSFISTPNIIAGIVDAVIGMYIYYVYGISYITVIYAATLVILTAVSIVDWNSYEIPIIFNYILFAFGVCRVLLDLSNWPVYIIGMVSVSGLFLLLYFITNGNGMGGGDIKLMFTLGLILGWKLILLTMGLGAIYGAVIHSIIMKVSKNKDHMLAFGPYLAAGAITAICFGEQILNAYFGFFQQVLES